MSQMDTRQVQANQSFSRFNDAQLSRDLLWVLNSQPLFSEDYRAVFQSNLLPKPHRTLLQTINPLSFNDAERLRSMLRTRRWHLLGIYYETLWQFLLERHPAIRLLSRNRQVKREDGSTLGEYDFIYQNNRNGGVTHLEIAVKFYLGVPATSQTSEANAWNQWVGPGLKDRMDRKLHRLLQHQITLSDTQEGRSALEPLNVHTMEKSICLQGYLFYPVHKNCPPPVGIAGGHLREYWVTASMLPGWLNTMTEPSGFLMLPKLQWLARFEGVSTEAVFNPSSLCEALSSLDEPRLVTAVQKKHRIITEIFRFFVVPDHWPDNACQYSEKTS